METIQSTLSFSILLPHFVASPISSMPTGTISYWSSSPASAIFLRTVTGKQSQPSRAITNEASLAHGRLGLLDALTVDMLVAIGLDTIDPSNPRALAIRGRLEVLVGEDVDPETAASSQLDTYATDTRTCPARHEKQMRSVEHAKYRCWGRSWQGVGGQRTHGSSKIFPPDTLPSSNGKTRSTAPAFMSAPTLPQKSLNQAS
jgi:hypothetical protein